jgi:cytoskeletal protein CcmA (bactofilin family)
MSYPQNRWTRVLFVIVILMGGVFSIISPARAQGINITVEDSVPAGEVVDNDAFLSGTNVKIDGDVKGDTFAAGSVVEVNGEIEGSLFAVGQNVVINGSVGGTVYVASVTLELGPEAVTARNVYYVGGSVSTAEGAIIERDLVLISLGAQLSGDIGRNTVGIIGPFEMFRLFMDLIGRPITVPQIGSAISEPHERVENQQVLFSSFLPSLNRLTTTTSGEPRFAGTGSIPASIAEPNVMTQSSSGIDSEQAMDWLQWVVQEFITLLVFGLLGIWLFSSFLKRSAEKLEAKPLQSTGIGLLGLVISVALIGVVVLVGLLILILGIGLGALSFWDLAWAVWGVGFSSLGLAFWLSLLFVSYGTKVIVAFLVGTLILRRLAPNSLNYKILPLILGLLIYVLLAWVPYFGWVIAVLVNAIGLGAAWFAFKDRGSEESAELAPAEETEAD